MRKWLLSSITLTVLAFCGAAHGQGFSYSYGSTGYAGFGTQLGFAPIQHYSAPATYDPRIDPALVRASKIADQRAGRRSTLRCWHFVKDALVAAGAVRSRPVTPYASQAGDELVKEHGFVRLNTRDPYRAPIGAVIVYSGHGAGHVELRTAHGFASDYHSSCACRFHVIGVYAKLVS